MAEDAFEPGEGNTFPAWPRKPDGSPDPDRMPTGVTGHRIRVGPDKGRRVVIDQTPRNPDGSPIEPPTIPPDEGSQ